MVLAHCASHRGLLRSSGSIRTDRAHAHLLRDLRATPVATVREAPVGGDDQADRTGFARAFHPRGDRVAAAEPVHLEEELWVGGDDLFDRLAGERRQSHCGAARGGGPCHGDLTVRVHGLHTRRRYHHRQRNILSHNGCREVALLQRTDHMWREPQLGERLDVVGDGHALLAGRHAAPHTPTWVGVSWRPPGRCLPFQTTVRVP